MKNKVIEILKAVATHAITSELNPDELDMEGFEEFADRIDAEYSEGVGPRYGSDGLAEGPSGSPNPQSHPTPEISEGEITDMLTKYSTTKLSWIKSAHSKNQLVIDPMDYHKIAKALFKGLKQVSEERIEEIFDANSSMGRAMSYNGFKAALKELNNE
jgi:hypothetical protein